MLTSHVFWQVALGGFLFGFGFAAGAALFEGIIGLWKAGAARRSG